MSSSNIPYWEKLIENQFLLKIKDKQFSINDLNEFEKLKYKYNIAIELLDTLVQYEK